MAGLEYRRTLSQTHMKFKLSPLQECASFLAVFALIPTLMNFGTDVLLHLAATLGFALVLYWFFSFISTKHKNIWDTVITALIIYLLVHYGGGLNVIYPLIATFIAMVMKFFVEYRMSPIVNPAAAGILLMAAIAELIPGLESPLVSWWGASFAGWLSLVLVALWLIFGLRRWNKYAIVVSFLLVHFALMVLRGESWSFIQYTFTDSTIYFLAGVMLIEPRTSPIKKQRQGFYGMIAALFYNVLIHVHAPYFDLFAIVAANLGNVLLSPKRKKKAVTARPSGAEE